MVHEPLGMSWVAGFSSATGAPQARNWEHPRLNTLPKSIMLHREQRLAALGEYLRKLEISGGRAGAWRAADNRYSER